jgi:hypothetical protein
MPHVWLPKQWAVALSLVLQLVIAQKRMMGVSLTAYGG